MRNNYSRKTAINSKRIKDLKLRPQTLKVLEENIGERPLDTGIGNEFLDITSKAWKTKAKRGK